jgi:hypothetical protein
MITYVITIMIAIFAAATLTDASCPAGKVGITIVKGKTGQVMKICVSDAGLPHTGKQSDAVIPGVCPCDMGLENDVDMWTVSVNSHWCKGLDGQYFDAVWLGASSAAGQPVGHPNLDRVNVDGSHLVVHTSISWRLKTGGVSYECGDYIELCGCEQMRLSAVEVQACAAEIWAFAVYELGIECTGDFPDFKPPPNQ